MRRKLILLNLILLALAGGFVYRLRQEHLAAQARQAEMYKKVPKPSPVMPPTPLPGSKPVVPALYGDIAMKDLFSKDRNPNVELPPPPPPPPPKPMPPLPQLHGVMNLGDGPRAILSLKPGDQGHDFTPGQTIGEFKLMAINNQEIVFEWDGKPVVRKVDEIMTKLTAAQSSPEDLTPRNDARSVTADTKPVLRTSGPTGPGVDLGGSGFATCDPSDNSPIGTVRDGKKKVSINTPFGSKCLWEAVK